MDSFTTNEEIALELGWKKIQGDRVTPYFWLWTDGSTRRKPPDFEHDWAHAGPLLEEMFVKTVRGPLDFFERMKDVWDLYKSGMSLTQAISSAWLAWKKEEK